MVSEKRLLQAVVAVLAITPVLTGLAGVILGPDFLGLGPPWPADLDSHFRFLSGILLAMGLLWWSCVPGIERKTGRFRLLAALTVTGGLARLLSLFLAGAPSTGHLLGLSVELLLVPPLTLWQARLARRA
ncbi:MAG TPA: DUF4345 domain-containing protein [Mesorhizobium sp.]|jgi:hypothetical protein|nr:DUF4345 domain-containing protein [Mesorhizobium sp.]